MERVMYRESKPGIARPLRELALAQAVKSMNLKLSTLRAQDKAKDWQAGIERLVTGFDEDCLSAAVGIVYTVPDERADQAFTEWAFANLFDYLLPGTWDADYRGKTTLKGFTQDFVQARILPLEAPGSPVGTTKAGAAAAEITLHTWRIICRILGPMTVACFILLLIVSGRGEPGYPLMDRVLGLFGLFFLSSLAVTGVTAQKMGRNYVLWVIAILFFSGIPPFVLSFLPARETEGSGNGKIVRR
jgi:hypothetical protein